VNKRREALSVKTNTGKFTGLRLRGETLRKQQSSEVKIAFIIAQKEIM